ncbi:diaminopimelate decarboxylase family protein [Tenggerimyces flavus]|uniref:Diaminopimelate decarboxylase family protein n=1 Tax=Tenggerimyces flavus TaxID=1708749 RepID=A0ABV7Y8Q9_9ACTN|nr:hypothetical protein [Tenggerimyces flavus]MBM7788387.1 diaminopimelate decarboxylase [Tenggerimyces flavus]
MTRSRQDHVKLKVLPRHAVLASQAWILHLRCCGCTYTIRDGAPWPLTTEQGALGDLHVGGVSLVQLAERFGTAAYVVDEQDLRARCRWYKEAFPNAEIIYAAKAFWCVTPGVDPRTHAAINTGVVDQKFGLPWSGGAVHEAVRRIVEQPLLEFAGLHCHLGSQITDPTAFDQAIERVLTLAATLQGEYGAALADLDLGGGHPVRYEAEDPPFYLSTFADHVHRKVNEVCAKLRIDVPRLSLEPGRAIAARAGVTVYRLVSVKRLPNGRCYVAVDGGLGDNPRPALYQARYTVRSLSRADNSRMEPMSVVGRYCEAGDVIAHDVLLPTHTHPGDLLAVATTGAYHHSMASSYNLVGRPPVIAVNGGTAKVVVRRGTENDLMERDLG